MKRFVLMVAVISGMMFMSSNVEARGPKTETVNFWVSIHCSSCQQRIMENLPFERGVRDISIDIETKSVEVVYNTKRTDSKKIRQAIEKLGYEVHDNAFVSDEKKAGCCNSKDPDHVCCKGKKEEGHSCTGQKDADHKCSGQKDADHKCTGQKDADHKCAGQKSSDHKCSGHKDADHKCAGQKSSDHKCSGQKDAGHKCSH